MAAASCLLTEDQFLCSICLGVFTDPVTIPCGHNFCKTCITEHWNNNVQCQCPYCKEVFNTRPELRVNIFISEVADQFRQSAHLKTMMCVEHDKLLELFCKTDQMCVCMLCTDSDHKTHDFVPLKEEYEGKKLELEKTEAEIQQMIQKRRLKIQEIKHSVELSKEDADIEIADGVKVFTALKESVERSQTEFINTIKEKQRKREKQAEDFIKELEQEISELKKRSTEVKQLSRSEDHLHLLQNFQSLNAAPPTKDWTEVSVHPPSYEGNVVRAVNQLGEMISKQITKLFEAELMRVLQYEVEVTLDPDTAHPNLILSDDGKRVCYSDEKKNLPDTPERFDMHFNVLAKQSFSSGKFYYVVQVIEKTDWTLGVARESINRKEYFTLTPQNGYWILWMRNNRTYGAHVGPPVRLSLKSQPQMVGVFVNYEEGLISFYDVTAAALIYSFTGCSFTEKLYPFFSPCHNNGGKNSAPLIISPASLATRNVLYTKRLTVR